MIADDGRDPISKETLHVPAAGETRLVILTVPPDAVAMSPGFDGAAAARENIEHVPAIASKMEPDNPGMHTTDTIDYGIVLEGEIWLEVDNGKDVRLQPHDVIIQNGTRHAWRNKSEKPAKLAFVLIGAKRRKRGLRLFRNNRV